MPPQIVSEKMVGPIGVKMQEPKRNTAGVNNFYEYEGYRGII